MQKTANIHTFRQNFALPPNAGQNSKQVGVAIRRFVARFGRSKVRALGLVSSGVKVREANRSDVEKERLDTRRDRSGALGGSKRTPPFIVTTLIKCCMCDVTFCCLNVNLVVARI